MNKPELEHLFRGSATPPSRVLPGEPPFTTRPELRGTFGMVASTHWLGTAAGMWLLEQGGNAFDAAVATALTLQVVEPSMAGPAGDAPIILYDSKADAVRVICGQGVAGVAGAAPPLRRAVSAPRCVWSLCPEPGRSAGGQNPGIRKICCFLSSVEPRLRGPPPPQRSVRTCT